MMPVHLESLAIIGLLSGDLLEPLTCLQECRCIAHPVFRMM